MKASNSCRLLALSGILGVALCTSGNALALPELMPTSLDTSKITESAIPDSTRRAAVLVFINNLKIYNDLGDGNKKWWRPKLRVAPTYAANTLAHEDVMNLNTAISEDNAVVRKITRHLQNKEFGGDLDGAFNAVAAPLPSSEKDALNPTPTQLSPQVSNSFSNLTEAVFKLMTPRQYEVWSSSLLFSFLSAGVPAPSNPSSTQMKTLISEAKKMFAGVFTVRLKIGMTPEEILLWEDYKKLYPDLTWARLDGDNGVRVSLDSVTNPNIQDDEGNGYPQVQSEGALVAASMFTGGSLEIPLDETSLTFRMNAMSLKQLKMKADLQESFILPVKFAQTIKIPYLIEGRVDCDLTASMIGQIGFKAKKYNNDDVFFPQLLPPIDFADNSKNFCKYSDNTDSIPFEKRAQIKTTLAFVQNKYLQEFAIAKESSTELRDTMLADLILEGESEFKKYLPATEVSKISTVITKECRQEIEKNCVVPRVWGVCVKENTKENTKTNTVCKDVPKKLQTFYTQQIPLYQAKRTNINQTVSLKRSYELTEAAEQVFDAHLSDGLCVVLDGLGAETTANCDSKHYINASQNKLDDHVKQ